MYTSSTPPWALLRLCIHCKHCVKSSLNDEKAPGHLKDIYFISHPAISSRGGALTGTCGPIGYGFQRVMSFSSIFVLNRV